MLKAYTKNKNVSRYTKDVKYETDETDEIDEIDEIDYDAIYDEIKKRKALFRKKKGKVDTDKVDIGKVDTGKVEIKDRKDKKLKLRQNIKQLPKNIFTPPYNESWFETENNMSLDDYIRTLYNLTQKYINPKTTSNAIKGILVPHAGIRYSGLCSATAYYQLLEYQKTQNIYKSKKNKNIKHIILFCTDHSAADSSSGSSGSSRSIGSIGSSGNRNNFITTSYTHVSSYTKDTNKDIQIDQITIKRLLPYCEIDDNKFNNEHSFYNQMPFIETSCPNASIIPFLISNSLNLLDKQVCSKIRNLFSILKELLMNDDTVLICTSDLSHINGHFSNKINKNISKNIKKEDDLILQFVYDGVNGVNTRTRKLDDILFIQNAASCGTMAMYFFAKLLNSYIGGADSSSSSSSSSTSSLSSNESSPIQKNFPYNNIKLYPQLTCYYTSLQRDLIHIIPNASNNFADFDPSQLSKEMIITDVNKSSVSYASLIYTS